MVDAGSLRARLEGEGLDPGAWSNGPGDRYPSHAHGYDKVIVVASGSVSFGLEASGAVREVLEAAVGDRLELPAGLPHDALVGSDGVVCLEAHLPAGSLTAGPVKRSDGAW